MQTYSKKIQSHSRNYRLSSFPCLTPPWCHPRLAVSIAWRCLWPSSLGRGPFTCTALAPLSLAVPLPLASPWFPQNLDVPLTWRRCGALRGLADPDWRRCLWHLRWRDMWSSQVHPLNNLTSTHSTPTPTPTPYSGFHICKNKALMPFELLNQCGQLPRKARLRNRPWAWASITALARLTTCRIDLHKYRLAYTTALISSFSFLYVIFLHKTMYFTNNELIYKFWAIILFGHWD